VNLRPEIIFITLVVLAFSLSFHEMAHAWTADKLGDPTARQLGRVSMNPVVHVDPIGTILFPLLSMVMAGLAAGAGYRVGFIGWAKPVPIQVRNLSRPRRDVILIALAGPASNILLAVVIAIVWRLLAFAPAIDQSLAQPVAAFLVIGLLSNLGLAIFNLLPIPPLDGGKVLSNLLPLESGMKFDEFTGAYGFMILYALMLTGILGRIVSPPINILASLLLS
jgi:Zn-dependent protease